MGNYYVRVSCPSNSERKKIQSRCKHKRYGILNEPPKGVKMFEYETLTWPDTTLKGRRPIAIYFYVPRDEMEEMNNKLAALSYKDVSHNF